MTVRRRLSTRIETWKFAAPWRITGNVFDCAQVLVVEIESDGVVGRGEAFGIYYLQETPASMLDQVERIKAWITAPEADRIGLLKQLPAGGARNAVDAALWALEAQLSGRRVWELAAQQPRTVRSSVTLGLDTPAGMAARAARYPHHTLVKVKLDAQQPLERMQAIRAARPDAELIVDANQGWSLDQLQAWAPELARLGVTLIEQPLPRGQDEALEHYTSPVPLAADESCLHGGELEAAARRYQVVNLKLDKSGGLTHALQMAAQARHLGLGLMVGCMLGTSLSIAPAYVLGLQCDRCDLDGPLLLAGDRLPALDFSNGEIAPFAPGVWA